MVEIEILKQHLCDDIIKIVKSYLYQDCSRCKKSLKKESFKSYTKYTNKKRISKICIKCLDQVNLINYIKDHINFEFRPEYDCDIQTIKFSRKLGSYDIIYKICKNYIHKLNRSYIFRLNDSLNEDYELIIVNGASLKYMTKEFYIKTFSNIQNSMLESI
jgi:hypothetical protein